MTISQDWQTLKTWLGELLGANGNVTIQEAMAQAAEEAGFTRDDLSERLRPKAADIWRTAADEIKAHDEVAKVLAETVALGEEQFRQEAKITDAQLLSAVEFVAKSEGENSRRIGAEVMLGYPDTRRRITEYRRRVKPPSPNEQSTFMDLAALYDRIIAQQPRVADLRTEAQTLQDAVHDAVITRGIFPESLAIINDVLEPSYEMILPESKVGGLAEVPNPEYETITEQQRTIHLLLEMMGGGGIGVAGPRGSGKTTLLRHFCGQLPPELDDQGDVRIMTSAPVKYEARDFILHLFALICRETLIRTGNGPADARDRDLLSNGQTGRAGEAMIHPFARIIVGEQGTSLARGILRLGFALIAMGLCGAIIFAFAASNPALGAVTHIATLLGLTSAKLWQWGLIVAICGWLLRWLGLSMWEARLLPHVTPRIQDEWRHWKLANGMVLDMTKRPGFPPVSFPPVSAFIYLLRPLLRRERALVVLQGIISQRNRSSDSLPEGNFEQLLVRRAKYWSHVITYQRSVTTGWTGSVKLPSVVDAGLSGTMSLTENPMSFPEIVSEYRDFVRLVARRYRLMIGIDELDKLATAVEAYQFVNDIKAIFNLPGCFYLVSVSEDALSKFARRGLPVRDEFDSAFDEIVYVDYIDWTIARRILNRRIVRLPIPFVFFCYWLSGGLPRDLVRACRELFLQAPPSPGDRSASAVCTRVIKTDLKSKYRAIQYAALDLNVEPLSQQVVTLASRLEALGDTPDAMLKAISALSSLWAHGGTKSDTGTTESDAEKADRSRISELHRELLTYTYYAVTLLQVFQQQLDPTTFADEQMQQQFAGLGAARQAFATSMDRAWELVSQFRKAIKLPVQSFPAAAVSKEFDGSVPNDQDAPALPSVP